MKEIDTKVERPDAGRVSLSEEPLSPVIEHDSSDNEGEKPVNLAEASFGARTESETNAEAKQISENKSAESEVMSSLETPSDDLLKE